MIDGQGRIVFDSSDDVNDAPKPRKSEDAEMAGDEEGEEGAEELEKTIVSQGEQTTQPEEEEDVEIDIASLGARFFPDLSRLDELDVCPSLKTFELGDPNGAMDIPFLRAPDDWRQDAEKDGQNELGKSGMFIDEDNPLGFDDTDGLGGFDLGGDVNFGEGGEAWAREAALDPQMRPFDAGLEAAADGEIDMLDNINGEYAVQMTHAQNPEKMHEDILSYFDQALQKNWTSAEHWRIRKVKDVNKPAAPARTRKEKEPFEIDFASGLDPALAEVIYTQASSTSAITLPKKDWKSKSRNLLPDDKHFNSKQLLSLFLKPKARMGRRTRYRLGNAGGQERDVPEGEMDEAFWASQKAPAVDGDAGDVGDNTVVPGGGGYDADFFADDGLPFAGGGLGDDDDDMDEFADARENFAGEPGVGGGDAPTMTAGVTGPLFGGLTVTNAADLAFGTMLVTQGGRRARPEYVNYARVAKKVDVRRLKEEIWKGMALEKLEQTVWPPLTQPEVPIRKCLLY
jgi:condensin complex subunit 2